MTQHLTDRDMELFANDNLPPAELLAADRHIQECARCRSLLSERSGVSAQIQNLQRAFGSQLTTGHLTYEELASCAEGDSEVAILPKVQAHLHSCTKCRNEVSQLKTLQTGHNQNVVHEMPRQRPEFFVSVRSFFQPGISAFAIAALLLCIAAGAWLVSRRSADDAGAETVANLGEGSEPSNSGPRSNLLAVAQPRSISNDALPENNTAGTSADVAANRIRDDGQNVGIDGSGKLLGYEDVSPTYRQMLERSLKSQAVDIGAEVSELKRPSGALMGDGSDSQTTFEVSGPFGKVISTDRPSVSWQAVPGTESYTVEVYDSKFNKVTASGALRSTAWTPKLPRGRTYILQVIALKDGVEIKAPRRPAPEARFHILEARKLNEIESAKRAHPKANLLLGLLYAKYGMLDEAAQKLRVLLKENPRSSTARKLLTKVQSASSR